MEIDRENGNTLWMDAIKLEMANVRIAFEEYNGDPNSLFGYTQITGHLVFDVKFGENFRRKARYCADGHKTGAPASVTYSTVVSRDSVRILLTIAALNDLEVLGADVKEVIETECILLFAVLSVLISEQVHFLFWWAVCRTNRQASLY